MRIRTIKPEFFEDEDLAKLSPHSRLLFIGCWMLADANGILENRPAWIKVKVFPYEDGEAVDASRLLHGLLTNGYLSEYEKDGKKYLLVTNFKKHQRISGKEAQSGGIHPVPENTAKKGKRKRSTREAPGKHPDAQEQGTGNREQEITNTRKNKLTPEQLALAKSILKHYPDRPGSAAMPEAEERLTEILASGKATVAQLIGAVKAYEKACRPLEGLDRKGVQQAATFFGPKKRTWLEYIDKAKEQRKRELVEIRKIDPTLAHMSDDEMEAEMQRRREADDTKF